MLFTSLIVLLFMGSDMILAVISTLKNDGSITVTSFNIVPRFIVGITISVMIYFVFTAYSKSAMRKAMTDMTAKNGLFCEHTITLDEKGFTETTEVNRNFASWEGVDKITETKNFVNIGLRLGPTFFIPKRAFTDENHVKVFVATVNSYIDHASIPPPPDFK